MSLRRLQLLVDNSASMAGVSIVQARNFIDHALLDCLRSDPSRFGSVKLDLCVFNDEMHTVCRDVSLNFFDTSTLESSFDLGKSGPTGPSLSSVLARHLEMESRLVGKGFEQVLYILISDGMFLDDAKEALDLINQTCRSPRLSFAVDGAETPFLALFERWPFPGFRLPSEVSSVTAQDMHELLMRL